MAKPLSIRENVCLRAFNTFQFDVRARYFVSVRKVSELMAALLWAKERNLDPLILGGGSNLVLVDQVNTLVIHIAKMGKYWRDVEGDRATLILGAGENWHDAVLYAAAANYRGIENLALIPGTVGAAPVQNIGAYGVELGDTLESLLALDCETGELVELTNPDCRFSYRDSLFKHRPDRYIILEVSLRLCRSKPFSLGYGELRNYFAQPEGALTPLTVAQGVMAIRRRKLPDPPQLPNAGSFFKNPEVSMPTWQRLRSEFPGIVGYPGTHKVKLAAAWMIDQCGWKGFRNERVGVHNRQALVLVNHARGTGRDILALADQIRSAVWARFGVALDIEPRVYPQGREGRE
ncbi:UDP-N-acetylmuramate dehydrogenase [Marinobacter sp. X15-166B]|uniref:UDP-N-acetylmuramate dehydrogenase n=1 Tax=Marinobacter sp. X15-166B TaxID=1897620 RepID=UPI00085BE126|nr:UDP-N-acetylmuramate dehydrogenase [Marinobacter sp. X15-166B]OEY67228.1 UDP-N-acetylenolpyruvoylglucosamine reductase [Marinobacter sp. X15-166B]